MVTSGSEFPSQSLLKKCKNRILIYKNNNTPTEKEDRRFFTKHTTSVNDITHMCEKLLRDRPTMAAALLDSWRPNDSASAPASPQPRRRTVNPPSKPPRSFPVVIDGDMYQQPAKFLREKSVSVCNLTKTNHRIGCFEDARNDFSFSTRKLASSKYLSAVDLQIKQTTQHRNKKQRPLSAEIHNSRSRSNVDLKKILSSISSSMTNLHRKRSFKEDSLRSSVLKSAHQKRMQRAEMVDVTSNISMDDLSGVLKNNQAFLLDVDDAHVEVVKSCCKLNSTLRTNKNAIRHFPCKHHNTTATQKPIGSTKQIPPSQIPRKSLKDTIMCKESSIQFADFLRNEFSEENLDFWLICEKYRFLAPVDRKRASQLIYDRFLKVSALNEINIDSKIRHNTEQRMKNPDAFCFQEAQLSVYQLMEKDSYRRFLESNLL